MLCYKNSGLKILQNVSAERNKFLEIDKLFFFFLNYANIIKI